MNNPYKTIISGKTVTWFVVALAIIIPSVFSFGFNWRSIFALENCDKLIAEYRDTANREAEEKISDGNGESDALPQSKKNTVGGVSKLIKGARVSAYSKHDEGVTCISASQKNICLDEVNWIACPIQLEFGTVVVIDEIEYICIDRMNSYHSQFDDRFDIWFDDDLEGAKNWGIRYLNVEIMELKDYVK